MDQTTDTTRRAIDQTREAMTDKMAQIEDRIKGSVDDVKGSVNDTLEQVKQVFDVNTQVQERPWTMLGASMLAGYILGSLGDDARSSSYPSNKGYTSSQSTPQNAQPGMLSDMMDQFRDELDLLKGAAVTTLTNMLRDTLKQNVPQFADAFEQARKEREQGA